MITQEGFNESAQAIKNLISHATYELNGITVQKNIYAISVEGGCITIPLYFDDALVGTLSNFKLITKLGNEFAVKTQAIEKPGTKGVFVRFKFNLLEG